MAKVLPFNGLRYNDAMFSDLSVLISQPYDTISPQKQAKLYEKSEYNIVRIDYGITKDSDNEFDNRYTRAEKTFKEWLDKQILVCEDSPCFYICEQIFSVYDAPKSVKGIISLVELEELSKSIFPHEGTISEYKEDRLKLMKAIKANTGCVFSIYDDEDSYIKNTINLSTSNTPNYSFKTDENVLINLWIINDRKTINSITENFKAIPLFIADGHHRYQAALENRNELREKDKNYSSADICNYTMMYLVSMDDNDLVILPTHRVIKNIADFDEDSLISCLTDEFYVSKIHFTEGDIAEIITERLANTLDEKLIAIYTGQNYYFLLRLKDFECMSAYIENKSYTYKTLDITILHTLILEKYLKIGREELSQNEDILYTKSGHEAIDLVKSGEYSCAFLVNPPTLSEIKDISLNKEKIPLKSTYFWPKIPTGIVQNKF